MAPRLSHAIGARLNVHNVLAARIAEPLVALVAPDHPPAVAGPADHAATAHPDASGRLSGVSGVSWTRYSSAVFLCIHGPAEPVENSLDESVGSELDAAGLG